MIPQVQIACETCHKTIGIVVVEKVFPSVFSHHVLEQINKSLKIDDSLVVRTSTSREHNLFFVSLNPTEAFLECPVGIAKIFGKRRIPADVGSLISLPLFWEIHHFHVHPLVIE